MAGGIQHLAQEIADGMRARYAAPRSPMRYAVARLYSARLDARLCRESKMHDSVLYWERKVLLAKAVTVALA